MPNVPGLKEGGVEKEMASVCGLKERGVEKEMANVPGLKEGGVETEIAKCSRLEGKRFCLLVAYRPSNMRVYLRDGSAQTILRAATLR